jgi:FkbM family methyltransferase
MTVFAQDGQTRTLMHLLGDCSRRRGFYIDVGAWHPDIDSVTKPFYDCGWCGINIEPYPEYFYALVSARARDINLCVALSDSSGSHAFTVVENSGLSTFDDRYATQWSRTHRTRQIIVETRTLSDVCHAHIAPGASIDFLKIDVEGWEKRVILGGDWARYRPRVIIVEATEPNTQIPAWGAWEPLLFEYGYDFAHFDGYNRAYVDGRAAG